MPDDGPEGATDASRRARNPSRMTAPPTSMPAATNEAPRQPIAGSSNGSRMPAAAKPSGTPVCFTENTRLNQARGTRWVRMCADAGLIGPCAMPIRVTAAIVATTVAAAFRARPAAAAIMASWQTRTAPSREIHAALPSATAEATT